jgi:tetratricopeptide (TPR) repeat protein
MTAEGQVAGTLAYMAPELLRGKKADASSDIWALGVVLYEMAAGSRPFAGVTGFEQSGAILHEPPVALPARVPAALQQIIRRCLAKDPHERYREANEVRSALEIAQVGAPASAPAPASASTVSVPAPAVTATPTSLIRRLLKSCRSRRLAWIGGVTLAIIVLANLQTPLFLSTAVRNARGYSLLGEGRTVDAIREFKANVDTAPRDANAYDSLGEAYLVMGAPESALASYERALAISPTFSPSRIGRAWACGMLGRFDQAIAGDPPDAFVKALLLSRVGRYDEADAVLADEGKDASALLLASMLAIERGEYADALKNVQSAEEAVADARDESRRVSLVLADLFGGTAAARSGDLTAARARLAAQGRRYKASDPTEKWWHQALAGEIALADADPKAALDAYAAGEPSTTRWNNLRDTSTMIFASSLSIRDESARAQAAGGDLDGAIQTYRRLLTPGSEQKRAAMYEPRYVLDMARLLTRTGQKAEAKQEYQRFLEFWKKADPGLPEVAEARRVISSL